jgi:hypothetical protein
MFFLPHQTPSIKLNPLKQLFRRSHILRLFLLLLVLFGLGNPATLPQHALPVDLELATAAHQFDFVAWESHMLADELSRRWNSPSLPATEAEQAALVIAYVDTLQRIVALEQKFNQLEHAPFGRSVGRNRSRAGISQELTAARTNQKKLTPFAEIILARQLETILHAEGFTIGDQVLPPVAFRFTEPPTALIISPRDRIVNQEFIALQPGLAPGQRAKIEQQLDQRGDVASYITDIGGLGSYPTMVIEHPSLPYLVETIAHEWTHNYLFTFPTNIAWDYQTQPQLMTINETTASLVGAEISRQVISRFYPAFMGQLPALTPTSRTSPEKPSKFFLSMRRIRQQVDRLLAEGQVTQAEAYMEAERLKLVAQGYNLRKLNQAYFAFHGSYALSPGSVDPIGLQIRQLRASSPSLKIFLDRVGWLNSYQDYLNWLARAGVE